MNRIVISKLFIVVLALLVFELPSLASATTYTGDDLEKLILISRDQKRKVNIPTGTFIVTKPIKITLGTNQTVDIAITSEAVIQGGTKDIQLTAPILTFNGQNENTGMVTISGRGKIVCVNCWNGFSADGTSATQGATAVSSNNFYRLQVSGIKFDGGSSYTDGNGDSAITTVNVKTIRLLYNEFYGWDDVGVYISGDQNEDGNDSGQWAYVYSNRFENNKVGIASKRHFRYVRVEANLFYRNFVDLALFPTANNGSGKSMNVTGNTFSETRRNVVDARCDDLSLGQTEDFDFVIFNGNKVINPFKYVKEVGAAILVNRGYGKGIIHSNGNTINTKYLDGAPIYYDPKGLGSQVFQIYADVYN